MPMWMLLSLACRTSTPVSAPATTTMTSTAPDVVRFVALGDGGEGNATQRRVAEAVQTVCQERGCDLVLYLGDNLYPDGPVSVDDPQFHDKFEAPYAELDLPFMVVLGNHDFGERPFDQEKAALEVAYAQTSDKWTMPGRFYDFVAGPAQFYALDTNEIMVWDELNQAGWMERAQRGSDRPWQIAFGHHPYISNGKHGSAGSYEGLPAIPIANGAKLKEFLDARVCGQVDLYLSGHDHNRQWLEPQCGTQFAVSGAAAKLTPLEHRGVPTAFEDDSKAGFLWVELAGDTLTAAFYDEQAQLDHQTTLTRSP